MYIENKEDLLLINSGTEYDKNKLFSKYNKLIYGFFLKKVNNQEIAKDLTQEVFIKICNNYSNYNSSYPFNSWIFKIINNHLKDYYKVNSTNKGKLENNFLDVSDYNIHEMKYNDNDIVANKLDNNLIIDYIKIKAKKILSKNEYELFQKRFIDDYTFNELKKYFQIDEIKINNRLSVIKRKLRNKIKSIYT
jgi:RNA polymerase sigma-70 factor (ECF subfamily)